MFGKIVLSALAMVIIFCGVAGANCADDCIDPEHPEVYAEGAVGYFEYPSREICRGFAVWEYPLEKSPNRSTFGGCITDTTNIGIMNTDLSPKDHLKFLNGERVVVYGEFRKFGEGEVLEYRFTKLLVFVLSRKPNMPIEGEGTEEIVPENTGQK